MKIRPAFAGVFAILLFILPIPGTIALRHSLLLVMLFMLAWSWRSCQLSALLRDSQAPGLLGWLLLLTLWIVVQAVWISPETAWAINEMRGQWLPALLAAVLGLAGLCRVVAGGWSRQKMLGWLLIVLLAQLLFSMLAAVPDFLENGFFPQGKTLLTAGKLEISYWNNLLLVFLAVDGFSRWLYRSPLSFLPRSVLIFGVIMVFVSNLAFGARNGIIGSVLCLFSLMLLVLWQERKKIGGKKLLAFFVTGLVLMGFLARASYQLDPRWATFAETAKIAWDLDRSDVWLHPDDVWLKPESTVLPSLESGKPVEMSAYIRIASIRAGLNLVVDYPLGGGYGRNAFGHGLRRTMETRLGHSHSGLIDWTVGVGLPGLGLWLLFMAWMIWVGARRYFVERDPVGLMVVFVVGGFFGRMLLDSVNRDHMLILFFLILGLLFAMPKEAVVEEPLAR